MYEQNISFENSFLSQNLTEAKCVSIVHSSFHSCQEPGTPGSKGWVLVYAFAVSVVLFT